MKPYFQTDSILHKYDEILLLLHIVINIYILSLMLALDLEWLIIIRPDGQIQYKDAI